MEKKILFMDMDGPLAEFEKAIGKDLDHPTRGTFETDPEMINPMYGEGFFRNLEVTEGAKEYMEKLRKLSSFDIYIASNAMTDEVLYSPSEKYEWLAEHFPWLVHRVMLTCDKGLLNGHYLVDDYREKWEDKFQGMYLWFDVTNPLKSWQKIYGWLEKEDEMLRTKYSFAVPEYIQGGVEL